MDNDGFTPRLADTAAPSMTARVGYPYTLWYGSMTPCSGLSPMAAPPRKWAVSGMLKSSPHVPPATPSIFLAMRRVTSLPAGIHVGFGSPSPCLLSSTRKPNLVFLVKVVIE